MLFWSLQVKSCGVIIQMELLTHTFFDAICYFVIFYFITK